MMSSWWKIMFFSYHFCVMQNYFLRKIRICKDSIKTTKKFHLKCFDTAVAMWKKTPWTKRKMATIFATYHITKTNCIGLYRHLQKKRCHNVIPWWWTSIMNSSTCFHLGCWVVACPFTLIPDKGFELQDKKNMCMFSKSEEKSLTQPLWKLVFFGAKTRGSENMILVPIHGSLSFIQNANHFYKDVLHPT